MRPLRQMNHNVDVEQFIRPNTVRPDLLGERGSRHPRPNRVMAAARPGDHLMAALGQGTGTTRGRQTRWRRLPGCAAQWPPLAAPTTPAPAAAVGDCPRRRTGTSWRPATATTGAGGCGVGYSGNSGIDDGCSGGRASFASLNASYAPETALSGDRGLVFLLASSAGGASGTRRRVRGARRDPGARAWRRYPGRRVSPLPVAVAAARRRRVR